MKLPHTLLYLLHSALVTIAAPSSLKPVLSLNPTIQAFRSSNFATALNSSISLHLLGPGDIIRYPIPSTSTTLLLSLTPSDLDRDALRKTLLNTLLTLGNRISSETLLSQETLDPHEDDPYESDFDLKGCFFGVSHYPAGHRKLTYGMVHDVLQGLWQFLVLKKRGGGKAVWFQVMDEKLGVVGVGSLGGRPMSGIEGLGREM